MSADPIRQSVGARMVLCNIVQDLTQYLLNRKKCGISKLEISSESLKLIETWGEPRKRKAAVHHQGTAKAKILFVDSDGHLFSGASGELLEKIVRAMHLTPDQVCICNAVHLSDIKKHLPKLAPEAIVTLGETAAQMILKTDLPLELLRSRFHAVSDIKVMPTFSPSLLIKDSGYKRQVWEDMKQVMGLLGLTPGSDRKS